MWRAFRKPAALKRLFVPVSCEQPADSTEERPFEIGLRQYQANRLIEDRFSFKMLRPSKSSPNRQKWFAASVFDGHGGWQVAEYVSHRLHKHFEEALENIDVADAEDVRMIKDSYRVIPGSPDAEVTRPEDKHAILALQQAYDNCDSAIQDQIFPAAVDFKFSRVARVGSCAISVLVGDESLVVANAGDCQAVLVRGEEGLLLNTIHNANEPLEQERMKKYRPHEDGIVCKKSPHYENGLSCRVKGMLQPTRSFGDFHLKSEKLVWDHEHGRPFLPHPAADFPYITAHPDVSVVSRCSDDKWLVLASDGLWDYVSPAEVAQFSAKCKSSQELADLLTDTVLTKTAERVGVTVADLKALPPGRNRRSLHDDVTVLVLKLDEDATENNDTKSIR